MIRLHELKIGDKASIHSFDNLADRHARKLLALGVMPGMVVTVLQLSPTFVIQLEYAQLAIDREIAFHILVQKK